MHHVGYVLACALGLAAATLVNAADTPAERPDFDSGPALVQRLAAPINLAWTRTPAQRALASLSAAQHVAILLDRRVDPDQELTLTLGDETLGQGLEKIARQMGAGYCQFGPVAYLGPVETARRLRTLGALRLEEVRRLPKARSRELLKLRAAHWEMLAEPRAILDEWAHEAGVTVENADAIPHDLWRETDLPALAWIDRVTLLAAQFDLTFTMDPAGKRMRLVPVPQHVAIARTYQVPGKAEPLAQRWSKALPDQPSRRRGRPGPTGRAAGRPRVRRAEPARRPTRRTRVSAGKEVYQLAVENAALDQVVEQLAARLKLEVQWDRAATERAGIASAQLISVDVKDATLDELLNAVFDGTGLAWRRKDQAISISAAAKAPANGADDPR